MCGAGAGPSASVSGNHFDFIGLIRGNFVLLAQMISHFVLAEHHLPGQAGNSSRMARAEMRKGRREMGGFVCRQQGGEKAVVLWIRVVLAGALWRVSHLEM